VENSFVAPVDLFNKGNLLLGSRVSFTAEELLLATWLGCFFLYR